VFTTGHGSPKSVGFGQETVPHAVVLLEGLLLRGGASDKIPTRVDIGHCVVSTMAHQQRHGHFLEILLNVLGDAKAFIAGLQPWLATVCRLLG